MVVIKKMNTKIRVSMMIEKSRFKNWKFPEFEENGMTMRFLGIESWKRFLWVKD